MKSRDFTGLRAVRLEFAGGMLHQILSADGGEDQLGVNHLFIQLRPQKQGVRHEIIDHPGIPLGVAVNGGESGGVDDGFRASRAGDLVADIAGNLGIGKAGKIVMDGDPLAEGFVNGLSEGIVEIGSPQRMSVKQFMESQLKFMSILMSFRMAVERYWASSTARRRGWRLSL